MNLNRFAVVAASLLVFVFTAPARAQESRTLEISFNAGRVTLVAENVTLREILAEWARTGGSKIVNVEEVVGDPVLLTRFENQPEAEVLRTLLREVPGYGASMRAATQEGASAVEAVYILATRSAVAPASFATPSATNPSVAAVLDPNFLTPEPESAPRLILGSPDDEIPPVRPIIGEGPPMTPETPAPMDPNLRIGPGGVVTSTIPGVMIPPPNAPPGAGPGGPPTSPTGGRGRGGGGGGGGGQH